MLRRLDFLALTDLTRPLFDSLARRPNHLPFGPSPERERGRYSVEDAFRTRLALDLAEAGCRQEDASIFVRHQYADVFARRAELSDESKDLFFGFARLAPSAEIDAETGREVIVTSTYPLFGTAAEVAAQQARWIATARSSGGSVLSMVACNASECCRAMLRRAARTGVDRKPLDAYFAQSEDVR